MDPLTAFSLAASVVQFVAFAGGLLKKSIEIHDSASGLPNSLDIQGTYQQLLGLGSSLLSFTEVDHDASEIDQQIRKDIDSIKALARTCASDCETLLNVLGKIKGEDGRRGRFKSLRAAFRAHRKDGEIKDLEERLAEAERQITLHLCDISIYYHSRHTRSLVDLQQNAAALALDQRARFISFEASLERIKTLITTHFQQHTMTDLNVPRGSDIENVRELLAKVVLSERDMAREQEVLRSLHYEHYLDRYQSIDPAHKKTFSWIFNPSNSSSEGAHLARWLRRGQGVFWITGKPGSGKSTIMKFLCDDAQTKVALREWARGRKLVIVSHYFWLSGTSMQKSQEGLFCSLLYGIFQQSPELIEEVCPARWAAAGGDADIESRQPPWTIDELLATISSIPKVSQLGPKFCVFVDGLDEYQGDHLEMCNTIQKLGTTSPDILKLCVSSRPWNDFEDAFGGGPQVIKMHQLTARDIRGYTLARLSEHWAWTIVSANTSLAASLIDLILEHAEGVFLWVVLVTKELREGLSNYDSLEDLYRRVEGFPSDLGQFFMHILDSVDPFYHAKMSTALQISLAAPQPLELSIYYFHEQEHADPDYALLLPLSQPSEEAAEARRKIIEKRLNGWCKGLLQVQKENGFDVHFLHRTVRDFLQTSEMVAVLEAKAPAHFSADLSIMKAYTAWMKSGTFYDERKCVESIGRYTPSQHEDSLRWMIAGLFSAAYQIQCKQKQFSSQVQIEAFTCLDEFERSVFEIEKQGQLAVKSATFDDSIKYLSRIWRHEIFSFDLMLYLSHKITKEPGYLTLGDMNRYIEAFIVTQRPDSFYPGFRNGLERVLEFGQDPNEEADPGEPSTSMFGTLMYWATPVAEDLRGSEEYLAEERCWRVQVLRMRLVSLFLEFGADPNASLNALGWNACRVMLAVPLEAESHTYDGDTYLLELDSLFDHGGDSEMEISDEGDEDEDDEDVFVTVESAREWFVTELQQDLGGSLNDRIIGEVASRLIRRIDDKSEAEAAWKILERAFPRGIYERTKSTVPGSKRNGNLDQQQLEKGVKRRKIGQLDLKGRRLDG